MGLINWIFDFYQQSRIERAADEATALRGELAALRTPHGGLDQGRLERAIGELALAAKTLQRLAMQKGVCTDDESAPWRARSTSRTASPTAARRSSDSLATTATDDAARDRRTLAGARLDAASPRQHRRCRARWRAGCARSARSRVDGVVATACCGCARAARCAGTKGSSNSRWRSVPCAPPARPACAAPGNQGRRRPQAARAPA